VVHAEENQRRVRVLTLPVDLRWFNAKTAKGKAATRKKISAKRVYWKKKK